MYQEVINPAIVVGKFTSKLHVRKTKVFPNSYSKLISLKDSSGQKNSIAPVKNKKTFALNADKLKGRHLKLQTPSSFNIPKFESGKSIGANQRPISVGYRNSRPAFLEPETAPNHFPNKSALVGLNNFKSGKDHEDYKFPLFRSKQINGFRLSISPKDSETDQSLHNIKTSISKYDHKGLDAKAPYSAINKISKVFEYTSGPYGLRYDSLLRAN